MVEYFSTREIPQNVWPGTTVDVKNSKKRIDSIRTLYAPILFLTRVTLL